jgi:hypothetical protein
MKPSELFIATRKLVGDINQDAMAKELGMSLRSYQMYEQGDYDKDLDKLSSPVRRIINKVQGIYDAAGKPPTQRGENAILLETIAALREEVREMRDKMLPTIETLANTIKAMSENK